VVFARRGAGIFLCAGLPIYMTQPLSMSDVNTPSRTGSSGNRMPKGGNDRASDLKSRLQRLQESPAFDPSKLSPTPPPVNRLPDTRASAPALISPVSLYDPEDGIESGYPPKQSRQVPALSFVHLAPSPGPSQIAPLSWREATEQTASPVTAKGQEILQETESILGALSKLPPSEQVRVLESRLRASARMYDEMVQDNMTLAKDKEQAEKELELANRQQGMSQDIISAKSPVADRQELTLMQKQMSSTTQVCVCVCAHTNTQIYVLTQMKI